MGRDRTAVLRAGSMMCFSKWLVGLVRVYTARSSVLRLASVLCRIDVASIFVLCFSLAVPCVHCAVHRDNCTQRSMQTALGVSRQSTQSRVSPFTNMVYSPFTHSKETSREFSTNDLTVTYVCFVAFDPGVRLLEKREI